MADFLLELRSEEIPARMQEKASADLARMFADALAKAGLQVPKIESFVTPRRLALIARDLPLETSAVSEERKGPRADAPEAALAGFLKSTGLSRDQLVERADAKGNAILFAVIEKPGRATADVIAEAVPAIIRNFPWPKSMRWGSASSTTESLRWVRPLQGIVALLGNDIVPIELDGIVSGRETMGHRFHSSGAISIANADDYAPRLREGYVIVDHAERQEIIAKGAAAAAQAAGLTLVEDAGLVAENAGLTEWPVPLLGQFDPAFLEVPREVIQLTMRTNQKYFAVNDAGGKLAPAFICTANIMAHDGGMAIVAGNEKVLAARLSDAKFFWEQDRKTSLLQQTKKLERITFHEKLGTVAEKVERIKRHVNWLVDADIVRPTEDAPQAKTDLYNHSQSAAHLCKADLVTEMVGEFPELQGIMGGYYARAEKWPDATADAIRDHYKPIGQGDTVPKAAATIAVSLADKLDTIAGFFGIEERPTGSRDPFALRRAALAVISTVVENDLRLPLRIVCENLPILSTGTDSQTIFERLYDHGFDEEVLSQYHAEIDRTNLKQLVDEIIQFIIDRLKVQQREAGVRHDLIDAVFALGGEDDLVRLLARVKALQAFVATDEGTNLLTGYKRAANILKSVTPAQAGGHASIVSETQKQGMDSRLRGNDEEDAEMALRTALSTAEPKAASAVEAEDFEGAMAALATLRAPIDAFFENVMVNDPDRDKRAERLNLLTRFRDAVHKVADFSKIEG